MATTFWETTSASPCATTSLAGDAMVEVLVVGAGFCGLNAALELVRRGVDVRVIDARKLAAGASGRSGGFISARFRMSAATVVKRFGPEMLMLLRRIGSEAVDLVARNIAELKLDGARLTRYGSITAALNARHFTRLAADLRPSGKAVAPFGAIGAVRVIDRDEVRILTGSDRFAGGLLAPDAAGLHPLNYTLGMAAALVAQGVPLHQETPALRIVPEGEALRVMTPVGTVRARQVILATNAYSTITPATRPLARGVIPFRSSVIATAPLGAALQRQVLGNGQMMFDTRRLLRWFRICDGRLLVGGRGVGRPDADGGAYAALHRTMIGYWPCLAETPIAHRWSGYVGLTLDALPHVGRVSERLVIAGGCNGNGVALASLLGRYAARFALGEPPEVGILDTSRFRAVPLPALSIPALRLVTGVYDALDRLGY